MPKENIDSNLREIEEKKLINKNNFDDEKDFNRVFGKDLKNSQNNSFSVMGNNLLHQQKINNKNKV